MIVSTAPSPAPAPQSSEPNVAARPIGAPVGPELGLSTHFAVKVDGHPIPVHQARVSAVPFNRVWPGHQRPIDQTELASFVSFDADFSRPVTLHITILPGHPRAADFSAASVTLRPAEYALIPQIDHTSRALSVVLDRPRHFTVEIGGQHHALHVFANPPSDYELPETDSPDLIHFGPGVHHAGLILPRSGQTVHLAEGAVVYGAILVHHADHVRVVGRGILDGGPFLRGQEADENKPGGELFARGLALGIPRENLNYTGNITAIDSDDLLIDGVILRDSPLWSVNIRNGCRRVVIRNVKIVGQWRYNADGINICSSSHVRVSDCFIRSFDDCVIARGTHMLGENTPLHDLHVARCVLWCDWGRALEVWTGAKNARISDVVYEDIHIVRATHIALDVFSWWGAPDTTVSNIRFENISIEARADALPPLEQIDDAHVYPQNPPGVPHVPDLFCANLEDPGEAWRKYFPDTQVNAERRVRFRDIVLKNIRYTGPESPPPRIRIGSGDDALQVQGIHLENIRVNPRPTSPSSPLCFTAHGNVRDLVFHSAEPVPVSAPLSNLNPNPA